MIVLNGKFKVRQSGALGDRRGRALSSGLVLAKLYLLRSSAIVEFIEEEDVGTEGEGGVDEHEGDVLVALHLDGHKRQVVVFKL